MERTATRSPFDDLSPEEREALRRAIEEEQWARERNQQMQLDYQRLREQRDSNLRRQEQRRIARQSAIHGKVTLWLDSLSKFSVADQLNELDKSFKELESTDDIHQEAYTIVKNCLESDRAAEKDKRLAQLMDALASRHESASQADLPTERLRAAVDLARGWLVEDAIDSEVLELFLENARAEAKVDFGPPTLDELAKAFEGCTRFKLGRGRRLLQGLRVSLDDCHCSAAVRGKLASAGQLLAGGWTDMGVTGMLAIHYDHDNQQTILHLGFGKLGSFLVTIPRPLRPKQAATKALQIVSRVLRRIFQRTEYLAVVDGDLEEVSFKDWFPNKAVFRSVASSTEGFSDRIQQILKLGPVKPESTALLSGLPSDAEHHSAIFRKGQSSWYDWDGCVPEWQEEFSRTDFEFPGTGAAVEDVLGALCSKRNVIILVAHANGDSMEICLPEPRPDGSVLREEDLIAIRDKIASNRPMVYLFCCRTARISSCNSLARALVEHGAVGVVAPQSDLYLHKSRRFVATFLRVAQTSSAISGLEAAERATRYRELEMWIG